MLREPNPSASNYKSHLASTQLATHRDRNNETDPMHDRTSLHIFLSNGGLIQKPLEPLQQGQRISMQPSNCSKEKAWKATGGCFPRQQDSIAGLLVLRRACGGPTRHEVLQVANGDWGRAQRCRYSAHDPPPTRGGGGLHDGAPGQGQGLERLVPG
eukprot:jgi/Botrbrau1/18835/Bobra.0868s0002.1